MHATPPPVRPHNTSQLMVNHDNHGVLTAKPVPVPDRHDGNPGPAVDGLSQVLVSAAITQHHKRKFLARTVHSGVYGRIQEAAMWSRDSRISKLPAVAGLRVGCLVSTWVAHQGGESASCVSNIC